MTGFDIDPQHRATSAKLLEFLNREIVPLEERMPLNAVDLPAAKFLKLRERAKAEGLWAMWAPKRFGGQGRNMVSHVLGLEALSGHRAGLYHPAYGVCGRYPADIAYGCSDYLAERYVIPAIQHGYKTFFAMSEPPASITEGDKSHGSAMQTTAVRSGDEWVINGIKTWINNGADAAWGLVFASTDPDDSSAVSCFIVEQGQYTIDRIPVIRADCPATLTFNDVRVPTINMLGGEGTAMEMINDIFARTRIAFSATHLGVARRALSLATSRLTNHAGVLASGLVDAEISLSASRMLLIDAANKADRGEPFGREAAIAKLTSSEMLLATIRLCISIYGNDGLLDRLPFNRWLKESLSRIVAAGSSDVIRSELAEGYMAKRF